MHLFSGKLQDYFALGLKIIEFLMIWKLLDMSQNTMSTGT